jgi:hypothetical protein
MHLSAQIGENHEMNAKAGWTTICPKNPLDWKTLTRNV